MPARRSKEETKKLHAKIRELSASGLRKTEVARRCGCSFNLVGYVLSRPYMTRAERAAARRALWTAQRRQGFSLGAIARMSQVSKATVSSSLRRAATAGGAV